MAKEILRVEKLNKFYAKQQILYDVDFSIAQGEVLALLGPSGSGKSTLIRCLNGLEEFSTGDLFFDGQKMVPTEKNWQQIRQKIGMVFQSYDLFSNLTVLENIVLGPIKVQKKSRSQAVQIATRLLKRVGLADYLQTYPRQLSGGQKQRIAIVRALALHPEVMLFDEVTASLDPEMVRGVLEIIKELSEKDNMTMIIVTHEMNFAEQIADRVLFLEDGHILENTPSKQFFVNSQTERAREFLESMKF
ncbi:amino acid ABC transporter ATP-binding protein [Liquorilactobacillus uvarum]|uniref:ABC superfamily ATP binding cassette transporter, ABC protein n=1 Tax=Liquorilactobacillus uvarum DSM 19971 TaxID=1423812 RepID=A0A0R1Q3L6_9LACO|nr:amino acid ABC transporter ATP-binding protein [Liquorilactobacillus uvarum]KRL36826.1 ABC superfamily ATP binding cassette transporter, ABC protein [Liquorilactobacillus uvarum DSM 19971]